MQHNKVFNIEDFSEPGVLRQMLNVFPGVCVDGQVLPSQYHRKWWESVMALNALLDGGAIHEDARILGVGAGQEPLVFYLTDLVEQVFAVDLYADAGVWDHLAPPSMLINPLPAGWLPPAPCYDPRRLVVQHMDGCCLRFPDNFFDGLFSSSSIEHFHDIQGAAQEMGRVLKPGGVLTLSTEFWLNAGSLDGFPGFMLFTPALLYDWIIAPSGCELVDVPDWSISDATLATEMTEEHAVSEGGWPHGVINHDGLLYTSVHLALRKQG